MDLKSVLDEVQVEVKREEEKRSELQLQYMKDSSAWELEKAELKCRIAQLEAKGSVGTAGVAATVGAAGAGTLQREREEQRRLLAYTHTAAMDLRCRLEQDERGWLRERSELLERFDSERREWEGQLRDMQSKIEQLYIEVRSQREGGGGGAGEGQDGGSRSSAHSTSTGSSLLSEAFISDQPSSSVHSDPPEHAPGSNSNHGNSRSPGRYSNGRLLDSIADCIAQSDRLAGVGGGGARQGEADTVVRQEVDTAELEAILKGVTVQGPERDISAQEVDKVQLPFSRGQSVDSSYGSDRKRNTTALNAALKEIARVSEELCSYQNEIRKKAGDKSSRTESLYHPEESQRGGRDARTVLEREEMPFDLNQLYEDLRVMEKQSWITWSAKSEEPKAGFDEGEKEPPPIPPRTTSWYLNSPASPEPELQAPECLVSRKCHSPCVAVDRKSSSPSIVRKFEAMLQVNEGKVLTETGAAACSVPVNSNCNVGCCHNRWSCDGSRFGSSKSSTYVPAQKSLSEMNILTAGKDFRLDHRPADGPKGPEAPIRDVPDRGLSADLLPPPLGSPLGYPQPPLGLRRNITLEQKTAEFNRTLFQAEMGRGIAQEVLTPADASVGCEPLRSTVCAEVAPREPVFDLHPPNTEVKHKESASDAVTPPVAGHAPSSPPPHHPEVKLRRPSLDAGGRARKVAADPSTPLASSHRPKAGPSNSPSGPTQPRGADPDSLQASPSVGASPKQNKPHASAHQAKAGGPAHPPPESRSRQAGHGAQPDTPRSAPRVLNDHPWKPLTLAAYPRPAESRSNYGAVERILRSYESAAWAQQYQQNQPSLIQGPRAGSGPGEGNLIELLDTPDMDHLSLHPASRHTQTHSHTHAHTHLPQNATHRETRLTAQESQETSQSRSAQRNFSRPARPANRRLPSRWASRSPSSSSSASSSPSTTPVTHPSVSAQRHTFSYSAYHTETVII